MQTLINSKAGMQVYVHSQQFFNILLLEEMPRRRLVGIGARVIITHPTRILRGFIANFSFFEKVLPKSTGHNHDCSRSTAIVPLNLLTGRRFSVLDHNLSDVYVLTFSSQMETRVRSLFLQNQAKEK